MAMSADGKIATANRSNPTFTSQRDQKHLLELRAQADAVMCGARTVDQNTIKMGPGPANYRRLRLKRHRAEFNLRIIVSGAGTLNPQATVFQHHFSPIIVLTTQRISRQNLRRLQAVADEVKICGRREINFRAALRWLRDKWKVNHLLCEGGGELNSALFRAGVVNELHLTIAPKVFGGQRAPTIADGTGVQKLAEATQLSLKSQRRIGDELYLVYRVLKSLHG